MLRRAGLTHISCMTCLTCFVWDEELVSKKHRIAFIESIRVPTCLLLKVCFDLKNVSTHESHRPIKVDLLNVRLEILIYSNGALYDLI